VRGDLDYLHYQFFTDSLVDNPVLLIHGVSFKLARGTGVKVTMTLSKKSVNFFKSEAKKNNTQYQKMIRQLLDAYARAHQGH
jgi:hypothetical protein